MLNLALKNGPMRRQLIVSNPKEKKKNNEKKPKQMEHFIHRLFVTFPIWIVIEAIGSRDC